MENLDAALRLLLHQHNEQQKERALISTDTEGSSELLSDKQVNVFLTYQHDIKPIEDLGYKLQAFTGNLTSGEIPIGQLAAIAAHPNVLRLSIVGKSYPLLTDSIPETRADQVWSESGGNFTGFSGKGSLVAILDTGIDFQHPNFRHTDGDKKTRILSIWDQHTPDAVHPDSGNKTPDAVNGIITMYGTEYKDSLINDVLKGVAGKTINQKDIDGHGTHVAGIAVGNGSQNGNCHLTFHYIGVAPEADIIIVKLKNLGKGGTGVQDSDVLNAMRYVITRAGSRKVVFNLSVGFNFGSRDGKTDFEVTIDSLLNANPNVVGIVAAGNNGNLAAHAQGSVLAGNNIELKFLQTPTTKPEAIEIWYPLPNSLGCTITPPKGIATTPAITMGNTQTFNNINGVGGNVAITNGATNALPSTAQQIFIQLTPKPATATVPAGSNLVDDWKITLTNPGATNIPFHAWLRDAESSKTKFVNLMSNQSTLDTPATAQTVITVANYRIHSVQSQGVTIAEAGSLYDTSSRGPTRDGVFQKPDLAAPGVAIVSTNIESKDRLDSCCCNCCKDFYQALTGTSMSAPHVAGTVALMWQKNNTLAAADIKQKLVAAARRDANTGGSVNGDWGNGKLDVKATLDAVPIIAAPPVAPPIAVPFMASRGTPQYSPLQTLQERFLTSPKGGYLLKVGQRHFNEIRNLINANKRVATVWHRCQGPAWLRTGFTLISMPDMVIPEAIANVKLSEAVNKLTEILTRYGSPELVHDLEIYQPDLQILRGGVSVFDLVDSFDLVVS